MKLYILRPIHDDPLWFPRYDKAFGFIVAAESEEQARALAQARGGDETDWDSSCPAWTDPQHSTCAELVAGDTSGVIMRDFAAA